MSSIGKALEHVRGCIASAALRRSAAKLGSPSASPDVRLVAVSKTKPLAMIMEAYQHGQRAFGENYVQELWDKSHDPTVPADVAWHFIGHLQTNKCNTIADVPQLAMVETIDSIRLADALNKALAKRERAPVAVLVQVNTSKEESKAGVAPSACSDLARHIVQNCPALRLAGLMTIGDPDAHVVPNPDFQELMSCRDSVAAAIGVSPDSLELSMGMSGDYEHAVEMGSTNVRIGSTIFGSRS